MAGAYWARQWVFRCAALAVCLAARGGEPPEENRPTRNFYIGAVELDWNYAPGGNQLGPGGDEYKELYLSESRDPLKLGQVYKKSVLREYTDDSFSVQKDREPWMGILGPMLKGEVGDVLNITFLNMASHSISIHPHGVRYQKSHEGALYDDHTSGANKMDDHVAPGTRHVYRWLMNEHDAPTENDPDCLTWMYHSHKNGETELHAGLLGPLLVCKKGALSDGKIDRRIALVFMNLDESKSIYIDENIDRHAPLMTSEERKTLKMDAEFRASNLMHTINGFAFGNLPGLELCLDDRVSWHLVGMGDVVDVHTASFEGQLLSWNGHRTDAISLLPAKFTTSYMVARRLGTWPIRCEVGSHAHSGMEAFFRIRRCGGERQRLGGERLGGERLGGRLREVFVAAVEADWDYAPAGLDFLSGRNLTDDGYSAPFFRRGAHRIGGRYRKALFREFADASFTREKPRAPEDAHLALLGPTLRAEVGDVIKVTFRNAASWPYSIDTHGAYYVREPVGVGTNESRVAYWTLLEQYGPGARDPDCLPWRYYSDVDFKRDAYDGLNGILLVCRKGALDDRGRQKNVDREFSLLLSALDENEAHYVDGNVLAHAGDPHGVDFDDPGFRRANRRYSINGRMYGNLEGLSMCQGDRVSWNVLSVGRSIDFHTAYFHGNNILHHGVYRDSVAVVPSALYAVSMNATNPGDWLVECHTNSHLTGGMRALYRVADDCGGPRADDTRPRAKRQANDIQPTASRVEYAEKPRAEFGRKPSGAERMPSGAERPRAAPPGRDGRVREYFVAAVEEEWEYAPRDWHLIHGGSLLDDQESKVFVERGKDRIGTRYKKALFREFRDQSFTERKGVTPESRHLAVMGPMIKAEVGELLRVTFRNMASRPYSLHPHGILHHQDRNHLHLGTDEDPVYPGDVAVYEWLITAESGPAAGGFNCTAWAYYSAVDPVRDTNSGLMGPLVICRKGILTDAGARVDAQHEFAVLYTIFDENASWYLEENIRRFARQPAAVDPRDPAFEASNRMHAVNGRLYGGLAGLVARNGTRSAWYLLGMGDERDLHTAHFHGQTFVARADGGPRRGDVVDLFPGYFETVEMANDNPGTWILHCHVDDHMRDGMAVTFTVAA